MKPIIAATDFSPVSLNSVNYAADMAQSIGASLLLFNVYNVPISFTDMPLVLMSAEEMKKASESQLENLKNKLLHISSGKLSISTEARMGNTADELEDLCKKVNPFAVVMGTKGSSGIERIFFGSTALTAIRHLTCPVICVPPGKEFGTGIRKIGFACDFRQVVETTPVQLIKEFVKTFKAELHIINVDYNDKHFRPETPEQSFLLHNMLEELLPPYHFINNPDIEEGISAFAEINNLDLLIAIPKKHKLLDILFKPSSTKKLVIHSHIPVMCIHE